MRHIYAYTHTLTYIYILNIPLMYIPLMYIPLHMLGQYYTHYSKVAQPFAIYDHTQAEVFALALYEPTNTEL